MKKILVTGTSGTGKTTLANELNERGIYAISIDEEEGLCSWIDIETGKNDGDKEAEMTKDFVDKHDWVLDKDLLNSLIKKSNAERVFVFGMASNQNEFIDIFDQIILLHCNPIVFSKRIAEREGNSFGKDEDVMLQIMTRSDSYRKEMQSKGAIVIDTDQSVDSIIEELLRITL